MPFIGTPDTFASRDHASLYFFTCQLITSDLFKKRYHAENRNLLYGDFKFGPLYMRLCYEFGLEEMAASALIDKVSIGSRNLKKLPIYILNIMD